MNYQLNGTQQLNPVCICYYPMNFNTVKTVYQMRTILTINENELNQSAKNKQAFYLYINK